jgi:hypothetical protein
VQIAALKESLWVIVVHPARPARTELAKQILNASKWEHSHLQFVKSLSYRDLTYKLTCPVPCTSTKVEPFFRPVLYFLQVALFRKSRMIKCPRHRLPCVVSQRQEYSLFLNRNPILPLVHVQALVGGSFSQSHKMSGVRIHLGKRTASSPPLTEGVVQTCPVRYPKT